jgi:AcrR family transcriptional regulator
MTTERRQQQRHNLRSEVLEVAQRIAATEGWDAVTMRRLAAEIGYTPPTLYELFGSKADLMAAVVGHGFTRLTDLFGEVNPSLPPPQQVRRMCQLYWQFGQDYPALYQVMFGVGVATGVRQQTAEGTAAFEAAQRVVAQAQPEAVDASARETTVLIWSAMHGLMSLTASGEQVQLKDVSVETFIDRLITGALITAT